MSRFYFPQNIQNAHSLACKDLEYNLITASAYDLSHNKLAFEVRYLVGFAESISQEYQRNGFIDYHCSLSELVETVSRGLLEVDPGCDIPFPALIIELVYWSNLPVATKSSTIKSKIIESCFSIDARAYSYLVSLMSQSLDNTGYLKRYLVNRRVAEAIARLQLKERTKPVAFLSPFHGVGAGHAYSYLIALAVSRLQMVDVDVTVVVDTKYTINYAIERRLKESNEIRVMEYQEFLGLDAESMALAYRSDSLLSIRNEYSVYHIADALGIPIYELMGMCRFVSDRLEGKYCLAHIKTSGFKEHTNHNQYLRSLVGDEIRYTIDSIIQSSSNTVFLGAGDDAKQLRHEKMTSQISNDDATSIKQLDMILDCHSMIGMQSGISHYASVISNFALRINMLSFEPAFFVTERHLYALKRIEPKPAWFGLSREKKMSCLLSDMSTGNCRDLLSFRSLDSNDIIAAISEYRLMQIGKIKSMTLSSALQDILTLPDGYPDRKVTRVTAKNIRYLLSDTCCN